MSEITSMGPERQSALPVVSWEEIREPGAYVEIGSGDLYRVTKEALVRGASPVIVKESKGRSLLMRVSENPFCTCMEARLAAARHNVEPNF